MASFDGKSSEDSFLNQCFQKYACDQGDGEVKAGKNDFFECKRLIGIEIFQNQDCKYGVQINNNRRFIPGCGYGQQQRSIEKIPLFAGIDGIERKPQRKGNQQKSSANGKTCAVVSKQLCKNRGGNQKARKNSIRPPVFARSHAIKNRTEDKGGEHKQPKAKKIPNPRAVVNEVEGVVEKCICKPPLSGQFAEIVPVSREIIDAN